MDKQLRQLLGNTIRKVDQTESVECAVPGDRVTAVREALLSRGYTISQCGPANVRTKNTNADLSIIVASKTVKIA